MTCTFPYGCKLVPKDGDRCRMHRDLPSPFSDGQEVEVLTARGDWVPRLALGRASSGWTFPVIWVTRPEGEPVPWPYEDVRAA